MVGKSRIIKKKRDFSKYFKKFCFHQLPSYVAVHKQSPLTPKAKSINSKKKKKNENDWLFVVRPRKKFVTYFIIKEYCDTFTRKLKKNNQKLNQNKKWNTKQDRF